MALSPKEALEQLLLTCIKSSPFDNFNEQEKEILAEAFSSGSTDLLKKPDLLVIPEALPDKDSRTRILATTRIKATNSK